MLRNNLFEIVLSAAVILLAAGFLTFMRWQTGIGSFSSYSISAEMPRGDQLSVGSDVKIAGVKVGRINRLLLEPGTYRVKAQIDIRDDIRIPLDSRLSVSGAMMSSPYLSISPGRSEQTVAPGETLRMP